MSDWYDKALEEFLFDLKFEAELNTVEDTDRVFKYLVNIGLIDYDILKEYLLEQYVEDEDE